MKLTCLLALGTVFAPLALNAAQPKYEPTPEIVEAREQFRDKGFGIFIHWGIYSMLGSGEWVLVAPQKTANSQ